MIADSFKVRAMRPEEIGLASDWAADEGWNPGLADPACFGTVDPEGFLLGELDGRPAATISVVNYDANFAFLGFYIVRPDLRGRGYGLRIWQAGMAHAGSRTVGLDGVIAQQENYKKSGFILAYRNVRFGGQMPAPISPATVALTSVPFAPIFGLKNSVTGEHRDAVELRICLDEEGFALMIRPLKVKKYLHGVVSAAPVPQRKRLPLPGLLK